MTSLDAASLRQSQQLAASLRNADKRILEALRKGLAAAVEPVQDEVRAAARARLPKKGGLNDWVARSVKVYAPTSIGASSVTATVTVDLQGHDLRALDRGRIMHPVFGRTPMVGPQLVKGGFVTDTIKGAVGDRARRKISDALEDVASQLAREAN